METREDTLAEDITGIDFRGGLLLLPSIFKEKIEDFIILRENNPLTPYPAIQLKDQDWKIAFSKQCQSVIKVEGIERCMANIIEDGDKPLSVIVT